MNPNAVEFISASANVRVGDYMATVQLSPIYNTAPVYYPANAENAAVRADGNDMPPPGFAASPFPGDPQAPAPESPQVSGKLGDGKLLEAGLRIFKLLRELGILKA